MSRDELVVPGVRVIRDTDDRVVELLACRLGPRAVSIALSFVRDRADAEDLVQEALVRTFERRDQLRDSAALDAWFYRILTRLCLSTLRKRGRKRRFFERFLGDTDEHFADSSESTDHDRLRAAVGALPAKQRMAITLRFGGEMSVADVAAALDVGSETAKTHLSRGMKSLRRSLGATDE